MLRNDACSGAADRTETFWHIVLAVKSLSMNAFGREPLVLFLCAQTFIVLPAPSPPPSLAREFDISELLLSSLGLSAASQVMIVTPQSLKRMSTVVLLSNTACCVEIHSFLLHPQVKILHVAPLKAIFLSQPQALYTGVEL